MKSKPLFFLFFLFLCLSGCNKDEVGDEQIPLLSITTFPVANIDFTEAMSGGNIVFEDGVNVIARGVCWSTSTNPTIDDNKTNDGTATGDFVSHLENLTANTTYYLRAYATNEAGTSYGEEIVFTTLHPGNAGTFSGDTIFINGGSFEMGSDTGGYNESPVHTVTLDDFSISRYEVTNAQYAAFLNEIDTSDPFITSGYYINIYAGNSQINFNGSYFSPVVGKENYPVAFVTWQGARAFCEHYGGRLPTEAEWEFAALGGIDSNGYIYSGSDMLDEVAWYEYNSGNVSHQVGTKLPNEIGLYDMTGNVIEWINDWYDENYYSYSPVNNPQGPSEGEKRVARGCGFDYFGTLESCTITTRFEGDVYYAGVQVGFRPVFD